MDNQTEYQYDSETEEFNIINFIKVCRFCDNQKKGDSLRYYEGLNRLKVCYFCRNEFSALRNNMVLTRISKIYKKRKIKQAKLDIVYALKNLGFGIKSGIHQHILEYVL